MASHSVILHVLQRARAAGLCLQYAACQLIEDMFLFRQGVATSPYLSLLNQIRILWKKVGIVWVVAFRQSHTINLWARRVNSQGRKINRVRWQCTKSQAQRDGVHCWILYWGKVCWIHLRPHIASYPTSVRNTFQTTASRNAGNMGSAGREKQKVGHAQRHLHLQGTFPASVFLYPGQALWFILHSSVLIRIYIVPVALTGCKVVVYFTLCGNFISKPDLVIKVLGWDSGALSSAPDSATY